MHVAVKQVIYTFMIKQACMAVLVFSLPFIAYPCSCVCSTTKATSRQAEDVFILDTVETLTMQL